jgi:hypothetical protein
MAKDDRDRAPRGILGDINPIPDSALPPDASGAEETDESLVNEESMSGGSRHDRTEHSGSRNVTEGVTGGTGTEVGGSRNYRTGTGATGGDIGNRPE